MFYQLQKNMHDIKEKGPPMKGVGGFRPVVDWRDITIKRRTVIDRNVIIFIVTSGIIIILFGLFLTILGFFVVPSRCPTDWTSGSPGCVMAAKDNASYDAAKTYCAGQDSVMPYIYNQEQNDLFAGLIGGRTWLALRKELGQTQFVWPATGIAPNFTAWNPLPDLVPSTVPMCAQLAPSGKWSELPCASQAQVACTYKPDRNSLILVGPVVMGCGLIVLILSIEVCVRRHQFYKRNKELLSDVEDTDKKPLDDSDFEDNPEYDDQTRPGRSTSPWPPGPSQTNKPAATPLKNNKTAPVLVTPRPSTGEQKLANAFLAAKPKGSTTSLPNSVDRRASEMNSAVPDVGASPHSLPVPSSSTFDAENSHSQDQLELILSPKDL